MVFLMTVSIWSVRNAAEVRQEIQSRRIVCGEYCDDLEEAAGYLSEQARNYVITGERKYLDNYWEEVHTGKRRDTFVKELEELGVSEKKAGLLKSAKSYSDLLIYLETRAMRLAADTYSESGAKPPAEVKEYILNTVEQSMSREQKYMVAVELLFGEEYLSEKEVIGQYTRQFLKQIKEEMDAELVQADKRLSVALTLQWILQGGFILLFIQMVLTYYYLIIKPVLSYHHCLEDRNKEQLEPSGVWEISMLGKTINHAMKAKDDFLAAVSHEIRTPLNSAIGYEILLEQTELSPSQKEYVACMKEASRHLLEMVNHLLDYTKLKNKRQELSCAEWFTESLRIYLENGYKHLAAKKNLDFKVRKKDNIPPVLYGDEIKVRQIAANLLSNAVKFTEEGRVEVTLDWKCEDSAEGILILEVKDSGVGIRQEDMERIFSPFEQAGDAQKGRYEGTGLGLSICASLVKLMGGTIRADSRPGTGSTFIAEIPQAIGDRKKKGAGRRVLLVDDNLVNQKMQASLLTAMGVSVAAASDGGEAVALYEKEAFDLILMDLRMPVMDGYKAAEKIRFLEKTMGQDRTPIIALTADGSVLERVKRAGMDGILVKPAEPDTMKAILGSFMDLEENPEKEKPEQIPGQLQEELRCIYCQEHARDVDHLLPLYAAGSYEELEEVLHKLRGASAAAGVQDIQAACCAMEECLKDSGKAEMVELIMVVKESFAALLEDEKTKMKAGSLQTEKAGADGSVPELIQIWRVMVSRGEFGALAMWQENNPAFTTFLGAEKAEALERALRRYDYEEVLKLLDKG